jgi:hypothetical protein
MLGWRHQLDIVYLILREVRLGLRRYVSALPGVGRGLAWQLGPGDRMKHLSRFLFLCPLLKDHA